MKTETTDIEQELESINGKFYILENRADDKNVKRFIYINIKPAMNRLKDLIKTVNPDKLMLSSIDITGKSWNITGVPWSIVAMGLIRGDVDKEFLDGIIENIEKPPDTQKKK
jgi:hypothetical protein